MRTLSTQACAVVLGLASVSTAPAAIIARWNANTLGLADGAPVSSWTSTVGGQVIANAAPANQPAYRSTGTNGRPSVDLDGTDDFLLTTVDINNVRAVYAVATVDTAALGLAGLVSNDADSRNLRIDNVTGDFYRSESHTGDNGDFYRTDGVVSGNDGLYVNNVLSGGFTRNVPHTVGSVSDAPANYADFVLGRASAALGRYFDGDVSEIILFDNVLDATQRAGVSGILAFNWGISPAVTATGPEVAAANALGIFAVPEPSLPLLVAFGMTGLMWRRRRS